MLMAIFKFINWIVSVENIERGNYSQGETIPGIMVVESLIRLFANESNASLT